MKLIFAIVQNDDSKRLIRALVQHRISVTLMIGVDKEKVEETLDIIKSKSSTRKEFMVIPSTLPGYADSSPTPVQVTLGGATVFIVDVEQFYRF